MVIDDDAGVRWVLQELFAVEDISCMPAENGPKDPAGFQYRPSLAIVDIKLAP